MNTRVVSIIMPAYNAARWIEQSIASAINQDHRHTEVLVVDDGSTDDTVARVRAFRHPAIRVLTQPNRGASAARNHGLAHAQGDYIQWLDADDLLAPDKISRQLQAAEGGADSRILLSSAFGLFAYRPEKAVFRPNALWEDLDPREFLLRRFTRNMWMNPACWLVSRTLTERAGGWDERLSLDDDGEYFSRIVAHSKYIKFVPEARVYYRQVRPGSLSRTNSEQACRSLLLSLRLCIGHLQSLEDSEQTRRAGLVLLQNWVDFGTYFYPDRRDLMNELEALALALGGTLKPASLDWRYQPVRALFGWQAVRQAKALVAGTKLSTRAKWDRVLQHLSRKSASAAAPLSSDHPGWRS